jgi:hypothetical protein
MQPAMCGKAGCNLRVTLQAFQGSLAAELVATGAIGRAIERLMRTRERAWRNLGRKPCARHEQEKKKEVKRENCATAPDLVRAEGDNIVTIARAWNEKEYPPQLRLAAQTFLSKVRPWQHRIYIKSLFVQTPMVPVTGGTPPRSRLVQASEKQN